MRENVVDEDDIRQLRVFNEQSFNTERRILQRQVTLSTCMLENAVLYPSRDINSIADQLDVIEHERLLNIVEEVWPFSLAI